MMGRPTLCDRCGRVLARAADAKVVLRFDEAELLVEAGVTHRWCSATLRAPYERVERLDLDEFLATADRVAALARHHDAASVTRVVKKAQRLAGGGPRRPFDAY